MQSSISFHAANLFPWHVLNLQFSYYRCDPSLTDDSIWLTRSVSVCLRNDMPQQFSALDYVSVNIYCCDLIKSV